MSEIPVAMPSRVEKEEMNSILVSVDRAMRGRDFIGGPIVSAFEEAFAAYLGENSQVVSTGCGQDSLELALLALDLAPGSIVLIPPNDGGFSALAVQSIGLKVAVVDVNESTSVIDLESLLRIEDVFLAQVSAVIVTHLHGEVADIMKICAWAAQKNIRVIEDCAQATGATHQERRVGTFGDVSVFSFYPTKNLGAFGDGGAVATRSKSIASTVDRLRNYSWEPKFQISKPVGMNSRLDSIQAAILLARLPYLDRNNSIRKGIIAQYQITAPNLDFVGSVTPGSVGHHCVVLVDDLDQARKTFSDQRIQTAIHYPYLNNAMTGVTNVFVTSTPVAERLSSRSLSLPCFPTLQKAELERICTVLGEASDRQPNYA